MHLSPERLNVNVKQEVVVVFPTEHGGHGEEPRVLPAGGATRAEEGDGHPAEEDPHGHGEFSVKSSLSQITFTVIIFS